MPQQMVGLVATALATRIRADCFRKKYLHVPFPQRQECKVQTPCQGHYLEVSVQIRPR